LKPHNKTALCFDDILLVPQESEVESRHKVDLTMSIGYGDREVVLGFPVIAAPMDTVCDFEMCVVMSNAGGLGILHRYMPKDILIEKTKRLSDAEYRFGVSVGATNGYLNDAIELYDAGARIILVDIANGHSHYAINAVENLRKALPEDLHIMAGNVATAEGFVKLSDAGADSVRVGIGGGSACTTRIVSGHGIPTLASIMEISDYMMFADNQTCSIIADGGIRNSGDMIKAFAGGADAVMVGSMFAGTDESPGEIFTDEQGKKFKSFRGMASVAAQKDSQGRVSVSEGISTKVSYKGPIRHVLDSIRGGLGSGCSYSGKSSLDELFDTAEYIEVTALSLSESNPMLKKGYMS
jgi:IMP dehydrogenase